MKIKEGQDIWLLPFEGEPRQAATSCGNYDTEVDDTIVVFVRPDFDDPSDDGLREVPIEQVEII